MLRRSSLFITATATAAILCFPRNEAPAFVLQGFSLGLDQRDFRVFNNFQDSTANDNQAPTSAFPGHQGAVLAIWKGVIEWGSGLHGDGSGDPSQPFDLGSGGANFDSTFQGEASDAGAMGDNVFSATSCSSGGVLTFTASSGAGGWQIRFCDELVWDDGPGDPVAGAFDLQGMAAREYGVALGLAPSSSVAGSTMSSALVGSGVSLRSIESDDIAGIQAIYGTAGPAKPSVTDVATRGDGTIEIVGTNFSAFGNEVWFTRGSSGGTGEPVKVTGALSDGSSIRVTIPDEAGPGDLLVLGNGSSGAFLSNAFPFDPNACPAEVQAVETVRVGVPANPAALLPGLTSGPVVGRTWDPAIDHGDFFPRAAIDLLVISSAPLNIHLPDAGTLLCELAPSSILVSASPGTPFDIAIPDKCGLVGASVCTQGVSTDGLTLAFTNALDVSFGTE